MCFFCARFPYLSLFYPYSTGTLSLSVKVLFIVCNKSFKMHEKLKQINKVLQNYFQYSMNEKQIKY